MASKLQFLIGGGNGDGSDGGMLARISDSSVVQKGKTAASDAAYVAKRLMKSTGKAAWIATTYFLVLGLPLLVAMDRNAIFEEMELQQATLLGAAPPHPIYGYH